MNPSASLRPLSPAAAAAAGIPPVSGKSGIFGAIATLWSLVRGNFFANLFFYSCLVVGFLHGWLKLKYPVWWMTFAFDVPLVMALGLTLLSVPARQPWFPSSGVSNSIKVLIACSIAWTLLPFDVPWIIKLCALRGWCFSPIMFLLGYHLFRTVRHIEIMIWAIMLCGLGTATYGNFFQSEEEIRAMMKANPELEFKLIGNFYGTATGSEFRRFSTFVSAAVFGVTMSGCTQFAISRFFLDGCSLIERAILLTIGGLCAYSVVLSGSRTSMLLMVLSLVLTGLIRGGRFGFLFLPGTLVAALYYGIVKGTSAASERFSTLLDFETVFGRFYIVFSPALRLLIEAPLGHGLGKSGHGVPAIFGTLVREFTPISIDGDLGKLVVDLGVIGIFIYGFMLYYGCRDTFQWIWKLRHSRLGVIGVPAGAWFIMSLIQLPTGSPYLGIPFGPITWILLGALRRMLDEYERLGKVPGVDVESLPQFASFITQKKAMGIFGTRTAEPDKTPVRRVGDQSKVGLNPIRHVGSSPSATNPVRTIADTEITSGASKRPTKRFLYRRDQ
jgi:hypothetical protein